MGRWRRIVRAEEAFSFLRSRVPDAEKRRFRGPWEIDRWLWDVKDAFCDAEDLLEEWNLEVMQLRESPSKDEKLNQVIPSSSSPSEKPDLRLEMSARTKKIRERIEAIAAEGRDLGLRECAEDGSSGIGKPALDRCLYEDDKVKKHFDVRIWEEEETRNPIKVDIGRRIVKMCDGIPLAIRMIGSLLFFKKTEAEWLHFEDEISELSADLLQLSYNHLPCHLKQCFAFCSLFPKDWVIDKQMLTKSLEAEGFILSIDNGDWDMEDIAHDYFMDLLGRNFFQDCVKDELGNTKSCRMHHLVNDLAHHVAGTEYGRIYHLQSHLEERTHHLSCGIEKLPSSICELKHLTFLDFSENEGIVRLPDSLTKMKTLHVLKLNMCYKLIELPRDIRKLVNLRHLEFSNYFILPGDDSCRESYGGLRELNRLNNLRGSLRIEVKGKIKDAVAESNGSNLKEKNSLVSLVLVFVGKERDEVLLKELQPSLNLQSLEPRGYGGPMFPSWMSRMPKLVQLRLFDCARCKSLPSLGELTSLKHLEIGELSITEYTESDIHTLSSLPNLSTLRIWECPNLNGFHNLYNSRSWDLLVCLWRPLQTLVATTEHIIGIDDRVKDVIREAGSSSQPEEKMFTRFKEMRTKSFHMSMTMRFYR
ncbi:putative disease resistance protein RGA4 [Eucalyptus grandis]|uniref:putative disease resistance protein RGA4 n=1 Tax=Eucalyptus grandis TaxID=71139 RepID=UPI00192ED4F2|nr:putative disease resistance protein RGA4 [Eucalyptus grandis]